MEYSHQFRLYPSAVQQEQISRNFGCCRYVYNYFLAQRQNQYQATGKSLTRFQQDKQLTALKQEFPWLKEADSTSLQAAVQDLDTAYQNFFRRLKRGEKPVSPFQKQAQPPTEI
ncbi:MAG: helix-turn-helix domain-containing protein [Oscillospiraceae bacterium]|nr:helix-turn-helix domain-containing protein [Oscillospiraceae bacterium]